jgi:hypothetical protein
MPVNQLFPNQVEIFFSVVQRKPLKQIAKPFKWKFTKDDMKNIPCEISYKMTNWKRWWPENTSSNL